MSSEAWLLVVLAVEILIFGATTPHFLSWANGVEIIRFSVELGLLAVALTPVIVEGKGDPKAVARRVLRENRGGRALVVGHSNTVPEIVAALTGDSGVPPIGDEQFDTMYVVTVPTIGRASVLQIKY